MSTEPTNARYTLEDASETIDELAARAERGDRFGPEEADQLRTVHRTFVAEHRELAARLSALVNPKPPPPPPPPPAAPPPPETRRDRR